MMADLEQRGIPNHPAATLGLVVCQKCISYCDFSNTIVQTITSSSMIKPPVFEDAVNVIFLKLMLSVCFSSYQP
jgi:hypothetical protein